MSKAGARRFETLVGGITVLTLILIGLVAVLELGPPQIFIYTGATPFNTGPLGTSTLYAETKSRYPNTLTVVNWSRPPPLPEGCGVAVLIVISPEIPYNGDDAGRAVDYISRCSERGLLVVDESGNANQLLYFIGSSVRVNGDRILDISSRLPYPAAVFNTSWGFGGDLTLDIASSLSIVASEGHLIALAGAVPAGYVSNQSTLSPDSVYFDIPVAYEDVFGNTSVFAIGDGSLFLNQVIESSYKAGYLRLYIEALDHLCRNRPDCYVVFDATAYIGGDPVSIVMRGVNPSLLVTPEFIASAIARILHPATWLPPALSWADTAIKRLVSISNLARILVVSTSVLILSLVLLSKAPARRADAPAGAAGDASIAMEGRIAELAMRPSTGRRGFLEVYRAIDDILYRALGARLASKECAPRLADAGVDPRDAETFCRYMRRMGRRASLETPYPLIVRWGQAIERALELYSEVSAQADLRRRGG